MPRRLMAVSIFLLTAAAFLLRESVVVASAADPPYTCPSGRASCYQSGYTGLIPLQEAGRDTWYFWTGGNSDADGAVVGDQALWRILAGQAHGDVDLPTGG